MDKEAKTDLAKRMIKRVPINYNRGGWRADWSEINGLKDGPCRWYHRNGQLRQLIHYKNGKRDGEYRSWWPNGKLRDLRYYIDGKKMWEQKDD